MKSPLWTMSPSGVSKAMPAPWGIEWDTGISMNRKGPCSVHTPVSTAVRSASMPASSSRERANAIASAVPYTGTLTSSRK